MNTFQFNAENTFPAKKSMISKRNFVKKKKNEQYNINFQKSTASWEQKETGGTENCREVS